MGSNRTLLVLGATGPTGREVVARALAHDYAVTALARRPHRLGLTHPGLALVAADLTTDAPELAPALEDCHAVVSALGRGQSLRSGSLMARAIQCLVTAMEQTGPSRLVFLSAYGVGGTAPNAPWVFRMMFRLLLADIYADKAAAESIIRRSTLNWTILAPVLLTNHRPTGHYRAGTDLEIRGLARIARADVAACMLACIDDPSSFHQRQVVAS